MLIVLNGQTHKLTEVTFLGELLEQLDLNGKRLAVEVNFNIVPRSEHAEFRLSEGDQVEIVHAIGGG